VQYGTLEEYGYGSARFVLAHSFKGCNMQAVRSRSPSPPVRTSSSEKQTITVEEAAEVLRVTVRTIYGLIRRQAFPAKRCGRSYRINREAFERWIGS